MRVNDELMPAPAQRAQHIIMMDRAQREQGDHVWDNMGRPITIEQGMYDLAFRSLWLAFAWNDHNFDAAHMEARKTAQRLGINSFEDANKWLSEANSRLETALEAEVEKRVAARLHS